MDPQQRKLLERGYTAFHGAAMTKAEMFGTNIAVSVGQWASEFSSVISETPAGKSVYASTQTQTPTRPSRAGNRMNRYATRKPLSAESAARYNK